MFPEMHQNYRDIQQYKIDGIVIYKPNNVSWSLIKKNAIIKCKPWRN
jgi:hypothetical protein